MYDWKVKEHLVSAIGLKYPCYNFMVIVPFFYKPALNLYDQSQSMSN